MCVCVCVCVCVAEFAPAHTQLRMMTGPLTWAGWCDGCLYGGHQLRDTHTHIHVHTQENQHAYSYTYMAYVASA